MALEGFGRGVVVEVVRFYLGGHVERYVVVEVSVGCGEILSNRDDPPEVTIDDGLMD
jgi:hypothetical protein